MLSIGTKKYRNLQEQVGYNTECIKKLAEAIDGITIEDKLVIIETDSGTFTDEELVILSGPLAFISNGSRVWMKDSETLVQFVYKAIDIVATEVGSAYFNVGGSKIVVNRETGAYNTSSDTIITTYSKSQIDSLVAVKANASDVYTKAQTYSQTEVNNALALKANLAGANFTGAVTAPTLQQTNANYSQDISFSGSENFNVNNIYNRFEEINGVLWAIVNIKLTFIRSETIYLFTTKYVTLPSSISSKLYDLEGVACTQGVVGNPTTIAGQKMVAIANIKNTTPTLSNKEVNIGISHSGANSLLIGISCGGIAFNVDDVLYLTARIPLTLI